MRDEAYAWLTRCDPFLKLVDVLRQQQFTIYQVARLVDPDANGAMSDLAVELLARLVAESGSCGAAPSESAETD